MVSRLVDMTNMNMDTLRVDTITWAEQFRNAMNVNGGNVECATNMDYIMHFLTFGWKVRIMQNDTISSNSENLFMFRPMGFFTT